jgi:hypothetical protein
MAIQRPTYIIILRKIIGKNNADKIHNYLLSLYNIKSLYNFVLNFHKNQESPVNVNNQKKNKEIISLINQNGFAKADINDLGLDSLMIFEPFLNWFKISKNQYLDVQDAKAYEIKYSSKQDNFLISEKLKEFGALLKPIADEYLSCNSVLQHFDLWHTITPVINDRIQSQNWHRDPEDNQILKVWVYLNDINEQNGAMEFIGKSHTKGEYGDFLPKKFPFGRYINEEMLGDKLDLKITAEGKKGNVYFVDTTGFHRGGFALFGERKLIHLVFTTPICPYRKVVY